MLNTGAKLRGFPRASQTPSVSGPDSLESYLRKASDVLFEKASDIYIINTEQGNMIETRLKSKNQKPWKKMHCPGGEAVTL